MAHLLVASSKQSCALMGIKSFLVGLLAVLALATSAQEPEVLRERLYALTGVNVVDVVSGTVIPNRTVIVRDGKIAEILQGRPLYEVNTYIRAEGKFVIPGLAEMHAHIPQPAPGSDITREVLFLYLANGITTIRGMLGHPSHLELRADVLTQKVLGPTIVTSGPSLNGNSVKSRKEARAKVTAQKAAGYDFLKLHPGLKLEVFDEIVATAREVGIPYAGHVSVDVGVRYAIESGYASIDHVDGFLEGMVTKKVDPNTNGFFGFNFTSLADPGTINGLVRLSKTNKVWVVPTQSLFERWFSPVNADELGREPEMKYMPASTVESWLRSKKNILSQSDFTQAQWEAFIDIRRQVIKELSQSGHGLLLGSDAPQVFNVPGFSIHHEMAGMARAGLSNPDILKSGTVNPAKFFDTENVTGQIKKGYVADFIVLDNNPLEDLAHLKYPFGVMVNGQWLSRAYIQAELAKIASRFEGL